MTRSAAAERMRRLRKRRAAGRLVLVVEVDEQIVDAFVNCGFLRSVDADDMAKIQNAAAEILDRIIAIDLASDA